MCQTVYLDSDYPWGMVIINPLGFIIHGMHDHKPGKINRILSCLCIPWYPMIHVPYIRDSCGWLPGLVNIQKTSIEHGHWNSEFSIVFLLNMVDLSSSQTLSLPESRGHFHLGAESWHRSKQTDPGPSDCGPLDFDGLLIDFWSI